jgi:hypothetical protein
MDFEKKGEGRRDAAEGSQRPLFDDATLHTEPSIVATRRIPRD